VKQSPSNGQIFFQKDAKINLLLQENSANPLNEHQYYSANEAFFSTTKESAVVLKYT